MSPFSEKERFTNDTSSIAERDSKEIKATLHLLQKTEAIMQSGLPGLLRAQVQHCCGCCEFDPPLGESFLRDIDVLV